MVDEKFNYLGKYAIEAYSQATGIEQKSVPIEDGSSAPGAGSIGSHWREGTFDDELMTPISNGSNGMGAMTIGAMKDLGYEINPIKTQVRNQLELGIWNGEDQLHNLQSKGVTFDNQTRISGTFNPGGRGETSLNLNDSITAHGHRFNQAAFALTESSADSITNPGHPAKDAEATINPASPSLGTNTIMESIAIDIESIASGQANSLQSTDPIIPSGIRQDLVSNNNSNPQIEEDQTIRSSKH